MKKDAPNQVKPSDLTPDQVELVKKFVVETGGIDKARKALEALAELKKAG